MAEARTETVMETSIVLTLSLEEAEYVASFLGLGWAEKVTGRRLTKSPYFALADAVDAAGGKPYRWANAARTFVAESA